MRRGGGQRREPQGETVSVLEPGARPAPSRRSNQRPNAAHGAARRAAKDVAQRAEAGWAQPRWRSDARSPEPRARVSAQRRRAVLAIETAGSALTVPSGSVC